MKNIEDLPTREKISPIWGARKGNRPTWPDETRHHWRKTKAKNSKRKKVVR